MDEARAIVLGLGPETEIQWEILGVAPAVIIARQVVTAKPVQMGSLTAYAGDWVFEIIPGMYAALKYGEVRERGVMFDDDTPTIPLPSSAWSEEFGTTWVNAQRDIPEFDPGENH